MESGVLKAIGDPTRWLLLTLLAERGYCVRALARRSGLSESAVSQHLKVLREAGLVYGVKLGYYTHYRVDQEALHRVSAEVEALCNIRRQPCEGPFYGCPESAYIRCRSYVAPEDRVRPEESGDPTQTKKDE